MSLEKLIKEYVPVLTDIFQLYENRDYLIALTNINNWDENKIPGNYKFIYYYLYSKILEGCLDYKNTETSYSMCLSFIDESSPYYKEIWNDSKNYKISILRRWIEQNGGCIENIKIEYYDVDYRGLYG